MSKIFLFLCTFAVLSVCGCHQRIAETQDKPSVVTVKDKMRCAPQFPIKIGTNLSGWLSASAKNSDTSKERAEFMTKADIDWIAERGFDHVRIPVDGGNIYDAQGVKTDSNWVLLHELLGWVKDAKMRAVFDLHNVPVHNFDTGNKTLFTEDTSRMQFLETWSKLQQELRAYPTDFLAYEILNEPLAEDPKDWNELFAEVYRNIRKTEPQRVILLGSTDFSNVKAFPELEAPARDSNLLLTFHFYEPYIFTHYKTTWADHTNYVGQSEYPGKTFHIDQAEKQVGKKTLENMQTQIQYADRSVLDSLIRVAVKRADELQLPLYCGEFGVFKRGPSPKFRYNWYRDVTDVLRTHGIPYANWDYKAQDEFGLRLEGGLEDKELIGIMTGE